MAEHLNDIATYVSGDDTSELAKTRAELAYALSCLDREMAIRAEADAKNEPLVKALKLARARIEYLGAACSDYRHFQANVDTFLPALDEVLASVGDARKPGD